MEKFIPYEKLSKKEKRRLDRARRTTWGEVNPVTRKPQNSKAYHRQRAQNWKRELPDPVPFIFAQSPSPARPCADFFTHIRQRNGNVRCTKAGKCAIIFFNAESRRGHAPRQIEPERKSP